MKSKKFLYDFYSITKSFSIYVILRYIWHSKPMVKKVVP